MNTLTPTVVLRVEQLSKSYGGVHANTDVDLDVREGEVHGLIGPNGAGKTTLVSMLGGDLPADRGRILLDGADISALRAPARARLGIRRSFQITAVFPELTVLENALLACLAAGGRSLSFWRPITSDKTTKRAAEEVLDETGIAHLSSAKPAGLSHGERRQLELAMVLAGRPRVLLLDEPFAGMGPDETLEAVERLRVIKGRAAILLVEHDLDAVFALSDRLSVMVGGTTIATGEPATIRADPAVQAAYLGASRSAAAETPPSC